LAEVSQEVKTPDQFVIIRVGSPLFLAIATITDTPDEEKREKMNEMIHTEVPKMFYEQFTSALKDGGIVRIVTEVTEPRYAPDAIFLLAIDEYGFSSQKPLLCATGRLILHPPFKSTWALNSTGGKWTVVLENPERHPSVWEKRACEFGQFVELPTNDIKFYANNLDITRDAFKKASQSVVDQLINDMKENYE